MTHVFMENMGTKIVEGIAVQYPDLGHQDPKDFGLKQMKLKPEAFAKMSNLRILSICCFHLSEDVKYLSNKLRYLGWCGCPMKYMPSTFQPEHLVELHLTYSSIEQLWEGAMQQLDMLRIMNLSHSTYLANSPDFTRVPNLERLILEGCTGLVNLDPSIGILKRLIFLNLKDCKNLKSLPRGIQLESLEVFIISGCSKLKNISVNFGYMKCLSELYLDGIGVSELPPSVGQLTNLVLMSLSNCKNLRSIPDNICQLKALRSLNLSGCSKLDKLPEVMGNLDCLEELCADWTAIRQLPSSIGLLKKLKILSLEGCKGIASNSWSSFFLPSILQRQRENYLTLELEALLGLESLTRLNLRYCNLKSIPTTICHIYSLLGLDLSGNNFESLPASMNQLSKLGCLYLNGCKRLQELPELPSNINIVDADGCTSLRTILSPSIYKNVESFSFLNCFKLVENKQNSILTENFFSTQYQRNSRRRETTAFINFPGGEIPRWFSHQSSGESSVSFELPPQWYNSRLLGIVFTVVGIKDKCKFCDIFAIEVSFKHLGTQTIVRKCSKIPLIFFDPVNSGNMLLMYVPRVNFPRLMKDHKEQLNGGGIEFEACLTGFGDGEDEMERKHDVEVEKFGVRLAYYEADEEASSIDSSNSEDDNMGDYGDLNFMEADGRSVGLGVEVASASATTSKGRRDDFNDNYYDAVAGTSGSGRFDDQDEDHLNSKRTK